MSRRSERCVLGNGWGSLSQMLDQRCKSQERRAEQMGKMRQVAEEKQSNSQSGGRGGRGGETVTARDREKDLWQQASQRQRSPYYSYSPSHEDNVLGV